MKNALIILICTLPSIALAVGAILTALSGVGGWGWFLFVAILTNPVIHGVRVK